MIYRKLNKLTVILKYKNEYIIKNHKSFQENQYLEKKGIIFNGQINQNPGKRVDIAKNNFE